MKMMSIQEFIVDPVSLMYLQDFSHYICSRIIQRLTEFVKVFQIRLVESVADDFNVHFIQVVGR